MMALWLGLAVVALVLFIAMKNRGKGDGPGT